jgi:hypothetical protein
MTLPSTFFLPIFFDDSFFPQNLEITLSFRNNIKLLLINDECVCCVMIDKSTIENNTFLFSIYIRNMLSIFFIRLLNDNDQVNNHRIYSLDCSQVKQFFYTKIESFFFNFSLTGFEFVASTTIRLSNYSSALSIEYETFYRPEGFSSGHYYETIQIIVQTTGTYDFQCVRNMDTYEYIYNGIFTRLTYEPRNFIARKNMVGNYQFRLTARLQAGGVYTLIVTTYSSGATGPFTIIASGPNGIYFIRMDIPRAMAPLMTSEYRLSSDNLFI